MDLEDGTEGVLGHHRALDVPARPPLPPWRIPRRVLSRLRRLPERKVLGRTLERALLFRLHALDLLPREASIAGIGRDAEIDVSARFVRVPAVDELLDEGDDGFDRLRRLRERIGHSEAEVARVLASVLKLDRRELEKKLHSNRYFVWVKRRVTAGRCRRARAAPPRSGRAPSRAPPAR